MTSKITAVLEMLNDGKWHSVAEIQKCMELSSCQILEVTAFLSKYGFAEIDTTSQSMRINRDFKKILAEKVI